MLGHANISIMLDTHFHVILGMGEAAAEAMDDALGSHVVGPSSLELLSDGHSAYFLQETAIAVKAGVILKEHS